jgi:pimeloyl-ACP methyl ester carboxylesterase
VRGADALNEPALAALPRVRDALAAEASMPLLPQGASTFVPANGTPKGVVVLFHGFSAGPWQFTDYAKRFADEGYHAYVPRLAGHGLRKAESDVDDPSGIPGAGKHRAWKQYADEIHAQVAGEGLPVHTVGISGGGAVSLDLATRHPDVATAGIVDPFFSPDGKTPERLIRTFHALDKVTFGQGSKLLKLMPLQIGTPGTEGHHNLNVGHIFALSEHGRGAAAGAAACGASLQIVSTGGPSCVSKKHIHDVFNARPSSTTGWLEFPAEKQVPHVIVHPSENKDRATRDEAFQALLRHVEDGTHTNQLPADL